MADNIYQAGADLTVGGDLPRTLAAMAKTLEDLKAGLGNIAKNMEDMKSNYGIVAAGKNFVDATDGLVGNNGDFDHQKDLFRAEGASDQQVADASDSVFALTLHVPQVDVTSAFALLRETVNTTHDYAGSNKVLEDVAKAEVTLKGFIDHVSDQDMKDLLKSIQSRGIAIDPVSHKIIPEKFADEMQEAELTLITKKTGLDGGITKERLSRFSANLLNGGDYKSALDAFDAAINTLKTVLGDAAKVSPLLMNLAKAIASFANVLKDHPNVASVVTLAGYAIGYGTQAVEAGMMGIAAWKLLSSSALLDSAAAKLLASSIGGVARATTTEGAGAAAGGTAAAAGGTALEAATDVTMTWADRIGITGLAAFFTEEFFDYGKELGGILHHITESPAEAKAEDEKITEMLARWKKDNERMEQTGYWSYWGFGPWVPYDAQHPRPAALPPPAGSGPTPSAPKAPDDGNLGTGLGVPTMPPTSINVGNLGTVLGVPTMPPQAITIPVTLNLDGRTLATAVAKVLADGSRTTSGADTSDNSAHWGGPGTHR